MCALGPRATKSRKGPKVPGRPCRGGCSGQGRQQSPPPVAHEDLEQVSRSPCPGGVLEIGTEFVLEILPREKHRSRHDMGRVVRRAERSGCLELGVLLRLRRAVGEVGDGSRARRVRGQADAQQCNYRPRHVAQTSQGGGLDGAERKATARTRHRRQVEAEVPQPQRPAPH